MKTGAGRAGLIAGFLILFSASAIAQTRVWTGYEMEFAKEAYSDWTSADNQDRITEKVWITRGDQKGIFNIAVERGYKPSPPAGTEWAYGTAENWPSLRFQSWETWNSRIPPNIVGRDAVLHLIEEDVYLDIKFVSWTESAAGGGFSYVRATEGTAGEKVWTGDKITFTKADYADWTQEANQDRITENVWITRRDLEGIFNIAREREYRLNPPSGTRWAYGTASNWASLTFLPWEKLHGKNPSSMVGKDAVVHLLDADVYLDVRFTSWQDEASGSGFAYQRATEGTPGEKVWSGTKITFTRANDADWTQASAQDRINDDVWITRGRWDGIFNIANEPSYQPYPPAGTEWAYGSAADWQTLTFKAWEAFHGKKPPSMLGKDAVLHLIEEDIYLDIKFTSWSQDDTGCGFTYVRARNDPFVIEDGPVALPPRVSVDQGYVSFRIVASDPDGDPLSIDWDFGDGETGSGAVTGHTYVTAGSFTVTVTVSDRSDTIVKSVGVEVNTPPRIDAGPTADPGLCMAGEEIEFEVTAGDDDGDPVTCQWSFGDGGEATGAAVKHVFAAPGDYTASVEVSDGWHAASGTVDVVVAKPLTISKLAGKLNFKKPDADKLLLKGELDLPADFDPEGTALRIDVGGVEALFVLDAKGKAKSVAGTAKLKFKKKGGVWQYQVKLKKGAFADRLEDDGLVDETVKAVPVSLETRVRVGETTFRGSASLLYTGREGKSGKFK